MEISGLLNKISQSKSPHPEQILALLIGSETVNSAVWQIVAGQTQIIALGSLEEWNGDADELLTAADSSLATALETISHEPDKVTLGLPESWVTADKISPDRQTIIKDLADKLSLKPAGFVVTTEALIYYLKQKEGTPLTGILIELTETEVGITLVKLGKSLGTQTVGRSEDLGADVEEGLARFNTTDPLPSRMLIFNSHLDLEAARQTLLSYSWQEKLPFLHFPKIEILDKDIPIRAIAIAGASELTTQVAASEAPQPNIADMGFYRHQDVLTKFHARQQSPPQPMELPPRPRPTTEPTAEPLAQTIETEVENVPLTQNLFSRLSNLTIPRQLLGKLSSLRPQSLSPLIIFGFLGLGLLLASLFAAFWYLPHAQVTLYLTPKIIDKEIDFTVNSQKETDTEKNQLKGELVEIEVEDTLQTDTTGQSEAGDKAKGEVSLINKTTSLKKFPSGTILIGPSNLEFELDSDTSVASQSADTGTWGNATAAVTAVSAGTSSNLSSDTSLTIKGFDATSYAAKTNNNLSGGTSRQVRSVAEADRTKLLEDLTQKLSEKASGELKNQIQSSETLIDTGYEQKVVSKKFSQAVGEETDTLSLTMKLRLTTLKFLNEDLLLLVQKDITSETPENFVTAPDSSQITISEAQVEDGLASVTANLKTRLLPQINSQEIISNLLGKKPATIENYLKSLPNFARVQISLSPILPKGWGAFPRRSQNINLEIKIEDQ